MVEFLSRVSFFHISLQPQSLQSSVPKKNWASHNSTASTAAAEPQDAQRFQIQQLRFCMFFVQENDVSTALCSSTQFFLNWTLSQARALSGLVFVNRHEKASKQMLENGLDKTTQNHLMMFQKRSQTWLSFKLQALLFLSKSCPQSSAVTDSEVCTDTKAIVLSSVPHVTRIRSYQHQKVTQVTRGEHKTVLIFRRFDRPLILCFVSGFWTQMYIWHMKRLDSSELHVTSCPWLLKPVVFNAEDSGWDLKRGQECKWIKLLNPCERKELETLAPMWFFLMFSFSFKVAGWLISLVRRFTNPGQGAKIKWEKYQLHLALFTIDPEKPVCTKSYEIMNWSQALESVCLQQSPEAHFAAQNQTKSMIDICSSMPYRPAWRTLPRLSHHSLAVWRSLGSRGTMWPCSLDASFHIQNAWRFRYA